MSIKRSLDRRTLEEHSRHVIRSQFYDRQLSSVYDRPSAD
jgi:hypothetical protein